MGRILAIDYGTKRTGIAVTDPLRIIPGALDTVQTNALIDFLKDYFKKEQVDIIVVGYAKNMDNTDSESMKQIKPFVNRIRKLFPDKEIVMHDERFTSVLAHKVILESGLHKMARRDKPLVDRISATIILQSYMDTIK
ncbi:MAG: Holliday junction resolvase RuvX [Bacteroidaceae bacterium]|nr:Holliday junction resolvase RuvX [Bacteroidaceae bacterium]